MTYYAVTGSRCDGVYDNAKKAISLTLRVKRSHVRKFSTKAEAEKWFAQWHKDNAKQPAKPEVNAKNSKTPLLLSETILPPGCAYAYVDGSFNTATNTYGYGGFVRTSNSEQVFKGYGREEKLVKLRNIAGELEGCKQAVRIADSLNVKKLEIYYDCESVAKMASNSNKKKKSDGVQQYCDFVRKMSEKMKIRFVKVAAHAGVDGNELADRLAKEAVGLKQELSN